MLTYYESTPRFAGNKCLLLDYLAFRGSLFFSEAGQLQMVQIFRDINRL